MHILQEKVEARENKLSNIIQLAREVFMDNLFSEGSTSRIAVYVLFYLGVIAVCFLLKPST